MTLDEKLKEIISFAIMDGQNQIHDLKDGIVTPEQVTDRMFESLNYHSDKIKQLIKVLTMQLQVEEFTKFYFEVKKYGDIDKYYDKRRIELANIYKGDK